MTLASGTTWSPPTSTIVQMVACYPYMNAAGTEITECNAIDVSYSASIPLLYYSYTRYPSVTKQPTFGTTTLLSDQLDKVGTYDCIVDN